MILNSDTSFLLHPAKLSRIFDLTGSSRNKDILFEAPGVPQSFLSLISIAPLI